MAQDRELSVRANKQAMGRLAVEKHYDPHGQLRQDELLHQIPRRRSFRLGEFRIQVSGAGKAPPKTTLVQLWRIRVHGHTKPVAPPKPPRTLVQLWRIRVHVLSHSSRHTLLGTCLSGTQRVDRRIDSRRLALRLSNRAHKVAGRHLLRDIKPCVREPKHGCMS